MRFKVVLLVLSLICGNFALAQVPGEGAEFKPFEVTCSLGHAKVPGAEDSKKDDPNLTVSLEGRNTVAEGRRLLKKVGDYEFSVATKSILIDDKGKFVELADYTVEIYNDKTKLRAMSDSGDETEPSRNSSRVVIKRASLRVQNNGATLDIYCFNTPPADKKKRLKLRQ